MRFSFMNTASNSRISQIQSERKKFFYRVSVFKFKIIKNFLSERQYLAYENLSNELVKK